MLPSCQKQLKKETHGKQIGGESLYDTTLAPLEWVKGEGGHMKVKSSVLDKEYEDSENNLGI